MTPGRARVRVRYRRKMGVCFVSKLILVLLAILLPPLAVFLKKGVGSELLISIILTLIVWVPGVLYAIYISLQD